MQPLIQVAGILVTFVWAALATFVLLKLVGLFVTLRVSRARNRGSRYFAAWRGASIANCRIMLPGTLPAA
ncbi:hypothetical protein [Rhodopseudomonas infernalis]|uniref:hypothetical protein n=1 Tax=Rhodopseudomonas infernalis TaxID=2897386 RepID=UPI003873041E